MGAFTNPQVHGNGRYFTEPHTKAQSKVSKTLKFECVDLEDDGSADEVGFTEFKVTRAHSRRLDLLLQLDEVLHKVDAFTPLDAGQTGGVYTVPDVYEGIKSPLAVFKSDQEEGFARRGIPHGGGAVREEAAYLLDRLTGCTAGVPVTARAEVPDTVLHEHSFGEGTNCSTPSFERQTSGSLQSFVQEVAGASEDFGMPRDLAAASHVAAIAIVQQVASLDIRLCNTDRHAGNLLFQKNGDFRPHSDDCRYMPVPIDHGCTLPRWWAMGEASFEAWISWPQAHAPCLPEVLRTVEISWSRRDEALEMLEDLGVEPASQATYLIAVSLLREGTVRHGLSLATIAGLLIRNSATIGEPSWVEARMAECAKHLGYSWQWDTNAYGDLVPAEPEDPQAWPPTGLVEALQEVFRSEATKIAGQRLEEDTAEVQKLLFE